MLNENKLNSEIAASISSATGKSFNINSTTGTSGGCINNTFVASDGTQGFFIKTNTADTLPMFEAEYEGLSEMAATGTIRVPVPVCTGKAGPHAWLVMENLHLQRSGDQGQFGTRLASMHRVTDTHFGWHRDNTIGSTAQHNEQSSDWVSFFRDQRLDFQLNLARQKGHYGRLQDLGERLLDCIGDFFQGYQPQPSMLHGDLWGGNYAFIDEGEPVIFDPAFYYGDREADIAMTELFGGFGTDFYDAYNMSWSLDAGYPVRKTLYNLYHIINHLNLFGGGYGSQAENMIQRLLAERNA
jgi:fructosamine-3-kinase